MFKSNILAHRGLWKTSKETNSIDAIEAALKQGFGVETDVRDLNGKPVISHDPPKSDHAFDLNSLLQLFRRLDPSSRIAINIKADGLSVPIKKIIDSQLLSRSNFYVFDMSIPDTLSYEKVSLPFYTRMSEYETKSKLLKSADGVWLDNFTGNFEQVLCAEEIVSLGKRVGFVSPELHGRPYLPEWKKIKKAGLHLNPLFELCTDHPEAALDYFGD
jgi:glycerophosphoryl diester phosphodiesterase